MQIVKEIVLFVCVDVELNQTTRERKKKLVVVTIGLDRVDEDVKNDTPTFSHIAHSY